MVSVLTRDPRQLNAVDPATGKAIGTVPVTAEDRIPGIVDRARTAQRSWAVLPFAERARVLTVLRSVVVKRADEIAETVSRGMGKPLVDALVGDVGLVLDEFDEYIRNGTEWLADEPVEVPAKFGTVKRALTRYVPRGVVCLIAPWNFPFGIAMGPLIPALAAGNAVILKPTSAAPMVGVVLEELFREGLPGHPDVVQVVHGPGALGSVIATAPGVDFVSFTGSTKIGRQLEAALAPLLRPALLELGGSDPAIVTDDANLQRAANGIVWGRFMNNGQVCAAVKRVYVERSVAEAFIGKVVEKVQALRVGPHTDHVVDVGPLANDRGLDALAAQLQDAIDRRAKVETGGFIPTGSAGLFWPPTVLTNVDATMRVMNEEVFGPILPIQIVGDDQEAIDEANRSDEGLDAYVFCGDPERAERIANRLDAGAVDINEADVNYVIAALPLGGIKQSGINRYHGKAGLRLFTNIKAMVIGAGKQDMEGYWFPHGHESLKPSGTRSDEGTRDWGCGRRSGGSLPQHGHYVDVAARAEQTSIAVCVPRLPWRVSARPPAVRGAYAIVRARAAFSADPQAQITAVSRCGRTIRGNKSDDPAPAGPRVQGQFDCTRTTATRGMERSPRGSRAGPTRVTAEPAASAPAGQARASRRRWSPARPDPTNCPERTNPCLLSALSQEALRSP